MSIFQLFQSDCITVYIRNNLFINIKDRGHEIRAVVNEKRFSDNRLIYLSILIELYWLVLSAGDLTLPISPRHSVTLTILVCFKKEVRYICDRFVKFSWSCIFSPLPLHFQYTWILTLQVRDGQLYYFLLCCLMFILR